MKEMRNLEMLKTEKCYYIRLGNGDTLNRVGDNGELR